MEGKYENVDPQVLQHYYSITPECVCYLNRLGHSGAGYSSNEETLSDKSDKDNWDHTKGEIIFLFLSWHLFIITLSRQ
jgi:hypothetical protein